MFWSFIALIVSIALYFGVDVFVKKKQKEISKNNNPDDIQE